MMIRRMIRRRRVGLERVDFERISVLCGGRRVGKKPSVR